MKFKTGLLAFLRRFFRQPLVWRSRIPDVSDDPQVTKAIADKIVDDARKHRLAIEGDSEPEGEQD